MEAIEITLTVTIDEEIDEAVYGGFHAFARDISSMFGTPDAPFVKMQEGGEWVPVLDWKIDRATAAAYRRIARHFIEIGKKCK